VSVDRKCQGATNATSTTETESRKSWGIFLQTVLDVYITINLCTMLVAAAVTINGPIEHFPLKVVVLEFCVSIQMQLRPVTFLL